MTALRVLLEHRRPERRSEGLLIEKQDTWRALHQEAGGRAEQGLSKPATPIGAHDQRLYPPVRGLDVDDLCRMRLGTDRIRIHLISMTAQIARRCSGPTGSQFLASIEVTQMRFPAPIPRSTNIWTARMAGRLPS